MQISGIGADVIGKTGLLAIRALALLAGLPEGQCFGAATIAQRIDAPPNYLGKLLGELVRSGLLDSRKGPGGGFRLARDPRSIRLVDVVDPLEQVSRWDVCFLGRDRCSDDAPCAMHDRWQALKDQYVKMLSETKLSDLSQLGGRGDGS